MGRQWLRLAFAVIIFLLLLQLRTKRKWTLDKSESGETVTDDELVGSDSKSKSVFAMTRFSELKLPEYTWFVLLILQLGCQPILVKLFMPTTMVKSTAVLGQECSKLIFSIFFLATSRKKKESLSSWTLYDAVVAAGIPAGLFAIQTYCNLMANQTLPPVTFVVLNQMKTLSTAWCCFILLGRKQSHVQILALILLVISTLVVQKIIPLNEESKQERQYPIPSDAMGAKCSQEPADEKESQMQLDIESKSLSSDDHGAIEGNLTTEDTTTKENIQIMKYEEAGRQLTMGVMPALFASFLSGLAGTLSQKTLQTNARNPHVFNIELAVFSSLFLLLSLAVGSPDCQKLKNDGIYQGWTWKTWVPIISNSLGGILVGLVTKYQGAVVKSFTMIFGMILSGILQELILSSKGQGVTREQAAGASLGALSLYLHASFPAT